MTMFSNTLKARVFASIAIIGLSITAPALADNADVDAIPQAAMNVKGADFSSPSTIAKLQASARRVARDMCFSGGSSLPTISERDCYNTAVKSAFTQIEAKHQLALQHGNSTLAAGDATRSGVRTDH
jgi:UrcA family protein